MSGKKALVVGASSGINLAIAKRLGEQGARLVVASRTPERIATAAEGLRAEGLDAIGIAGDVRDAAAMEDVAGQAARHLGGIDIVVSGAAGNFFASAEEMSANGFRTVVEIDLIGTFNVFKAAFAHLTRPGASLVAVSAPQAQRAMRNQAHACAAKAGVDMLTKCLALEWGAHGIRVNGVSPGPIADTEGLARLTGEGDLADRVQAALALPYFGRGSDVGDAVAFLCSDAARYVTGTILDCDGGMRLGDLPVPSGSR
ncbi:SDR family oxidoreductase [Sphingopyxis sp. SE2]|uniref:SDR family oxidoreductase n=1 Tax=Sphingopyxis sp. SE2 TaxID=1586240 RepID=UPI0028C01DFC|nr:SDR family oxidoreductase [Sphingopyxis sp. SE2]MDT7529104.1 SDR family oxidoreductase [Sphingopyxis sp. SE2]